MRRRAAVAVVTAMVAATLAWATPSQADNPYGPGYTACGSFRAKVGQIDVYARHLSCRRAMRIQREYWLGKRRNKRFVNGGNGANAYTLLDKYPGWRCNSGAGGGNCRKRNSEADYVVGGGHEPRASHHRPTAADGLLLRSPAIATTRRRPSWLG